MMVAGVETMMLARRLLSFIYPFLNWLSLISKNIIIYTFSRHLQCTSTPRKHQDGGRHYFDCVWEAISSFTADEDVNKCLSVVLHKLQNNASEEKSDLQIVCCFGSIRLKAVRFDCL